MNSPCLNSASFPLSNLYMPDAKSSPFLFYQYSSPHVGDTQYIEINGWAIPSAGSFRGPWAYP